MNDEAKAEREARLQNHFKYWDWVDKIRDMSLDALDDISVSDIISVLDRVKVELLQREVIVALQEEMKEDSEEEQEDEPEISGTQLDLKNMIPMVGSGIMEEAKGGIISN